MSISYQQSKMNFESNKFRSNILVYCKFRVYKAYRLQNRFMEMYVHPLLLLNTHPSLAGPFVLFEKLWRLNNFNGVFARNV